MGAAAASCRCTERGDRTNGLAADAHDFVHEGMPWSHGSSDAEFIVESKHSLVGMEPPEQDDCEFKHAAAEEGSDDEIASRSITKMTQPTVAAARLHELKVLTSVCCASMGCKG
mmetsp:Transcript_3416/g.7867  ORF Transcript_3416/g.7867 Transcript_3416/m.7867 type:complete len:114 (-) Transcript_3416:133-474(-)